MFSNRKEMKQKYFLGMSICGLRQGYLRVIAKSAF